MLLSEPSSVETLPVEEVEDKGDQVENAVLFDGSGNDPSVELIDTEMEERKSEFKESLNSLNLRVSLSSKYWSKSQLENISKMTMQICMQQQDLLDVEQDKMQENLTQESGETKQILDRTNENESVSYLPGVFPQEIPTTTGQQHNVTSEQDFGEILGEKEVETPNQGNQTEDEVYLRKEMVNTLKELLEATRQNGRLLMMLDSSIKKNTMVLQNFTDLQRAKLKEEESC
ncbi:uncharacterized protein LOC133178253 [Saccostrea echinata]|uniref:uncharacterized protein LOC133178253 n=1 Tax=Saccostrea echinata TaxID=191078 RepID=UPI002A7F7C88|nr:uncharacterized protein LOC133178253 [Saccostrea echinata]